MKMLPAVPPVAFGGPDHYNAIVKTVQWFGFCGVTVNAKERSVSLVCFVNKLITVSFPLHSLSPLKRQTV